MKLIKNILASFTILAAILLLSSCGKSPQNRLYDQGQAAYHAQNYHTAFVKLVAAARHNNVQAQYAVGYMAYYGIGVPRDETLAFLWLQKAAAAGSAQAASALQAIRQKAPNPLSFNTATKAPTTPSSPPQAKTASGQPSNLNTVAQSDNKAQSKPDASTQLAQSE